MPASSGSPADAVRLDDSVSCPSDLGNWSIAGQSGTMSSSATLSSDARRVQILTKLLAALDVHAGLQRTEVREGGACAASAPAAPPMCGSSSEAATKLAIAQTEAAAAALHAEAHQGDTPAAVPVAANGGSSGASARSLVTGPGPASRRSSGASNANVQRDDTDACGRCAESGDCVTGSGGNDVGAVYFGRGQRPLLPVREARRVAELSSPRVSPQRSARGACSAAGPTQRRCGGAPAVDAPSCGTGGASSPSSCNGLATRTPRHSGASESLVAWCSGSNRTPRHSVTGDGGSPTRPRQDPSRSSLHSSIHAPSEAVTGEAELVATLGLLEPRLAMPLQERIADIVGDIESKRVRVREQQQQILQLQKEADEAKKLNAKIDDLDRQNKMFADRAFRDSGRFQSEEEALQERARENQEACLMGAEDANVERSLIYDIKVAMIKVNRDKHALVQARQMLEETCTRLQALEELKAESEVKAKENPLLFDQIQVFRKAAEHRRWR